MSVHATCVGRNETDGSVPSLSGTSWKGCCVNAAIGQLLLHTAAVDCFFMLNGWSPQQRGVVPASSRLCHNPLKQ